MKKLSIFIFALMSNLISCNGQNPTPPPVPEKTALDFGMSMGIGWNLGNQLDAHINGVSGETFWGNQEATQQTFNNVAKAGFRSVRLAPAPHPPS